MSRFYIIVMAFMVICLGWPHNATAKTSAPPNPFGPLVGIEKVHFSDTPTIHTIAELRRCDKTFVYQPDNVRRAKFRGSFKHRLRQAQRLRTLVGFYVNGDLIGPDSNAPSAWVACEASLRHHDQMLADRARFKALAYSDKPDGHGGFKPWRIIAAELQTRVNDLTTLAYKFTPAKDGNQTKTAWRDIAKDQSNWGHGWMIVAIIASILAAIGWLLFRFQLNDNRSAELRPINPRASQSQHAN